MLMIACKRGDYLPWQLTPAEPKRCQPIFITIIGMYRSFGSCYRLYLPENARLLEVCVGLFWSKYIFMQWNIFLKNVSFHPAAKPVSNLRVKPQLCFSCWASLNMDYLPTLKYAGQPTTRIRVWHWPTYDELFSLSQVRVHWELSPVPSKTFIPPPDPSTCFFLTLPTLLPFSRRCHFAFPSVSFGQDIISSRGKSEISSESEQPVRYASQL